MTKSLKKTTVLGLFAMALMFTFSSCQKDPVVPEPPTTDLRNIDLTQDVSEEQYAELEAQMLAQEEMDAQSLAAYYSFTGDFELSYDDVVRIAVGGAIYNSTRDEWLSGGSAGSGQIPPALFAQLDSLAPHQIRMQVRNHWFPLRQIRMTLLDQGNKVLYGLYNNNNGTYLFLGANAGGGTIGNTPCGAIGLAATSGRIAADQLAIVNGDLSYGFIAGCSPILVAASISFKYDGVRVN